MYKETNISYLAGLLDGEGCLGFVNNYLYRYPKCSIAMCDKKVIQWVHKTFGGRFRTLYPSQSWNSFGKKPQYVCYFRKNEMLLILPLILPYLIGKKEIVKKMLKWFETPRQYIRRK